MDNEFADAILEGRNLVAAALAGELPAVSFREEPIRKLEELLERNRSVLVVGGSGVGKTAVIHGLSRRLAAGGRIGLRQLSTAQVMAGTKYIGEWETKLSTIAEVAAHNGIVLYWTDIWNIASAGRTVQTTMTMLDALRPRVESGELRLIGEMTPDVLRAMARVPRFISLFETLEVAPLGASEVATLVDEECERVGLEAEREARAAIIALTNRFRGARAQPGPALDLLTQVHDYLSQKRAIDEDEPPTTTFVEKVFSIYTGLPRFVVSRSETKPVGEIRSWFQERIVGQKDAIESVVETIALFKAGLHDPARPIGTFLFVGPTGVGKTELARQLAAFLFGSPHRLLRFDLSEFKDYSSFELLIGSPSRPEAPARLLDPLRSHPFQVILLDELEKAHPNLWDLLLPLLDDGTLTPPGGSPVSFRNTIVIATSNVGAQESERSPGFRAAGMSAAREARMRESLESEFRPELLNRFQHIVLFHPLTKGHVRDVARKELARVLGREGITERGLVVDVDDRALDGVVATGFDPRYGARALKREIQQKIVLPLAVALMERDVPPGALVKIGHGDSGVKVKVLDTPESRDARREAAPVRVAGREKLDRPALRARVAELERRIESLAESVDEPFLEKERADLRLLRKEPDFWSDPESAARATRDLDRYSVMLERLSRFRRTANELREAAKDGATRREVEQTASRLVAVEESLESARREMVSIGREGAWDALVEIRPTGGRTARDLLVDAYAGWARSRRFEVQWLEEPREDGESAWIACIGAYAFGYLRAEAGVHRSRDGESVTAATVRVAPWGVARSDVSFKSQRALKATGQFGGKIRSKVETSDGLVLQNSSTLDENRELAKELAPSWEEAPVPPDRIVRRYDLSPFKIRDAETGFSSGHPEALKPRRFHALLCRRIDGASG